MPDEGVGVVIESIYVPHPQWHRMEAYMKIIDEASHLNVLSLNAFIDEDVKQCPAVQQRERRTHQLVI